MIWGVHVPFGTKYKPSCRLFIVVIIIIIVLKQMHTWIAIHNQRDEISSTGQILKLDKTSEGLEVEFYHVWRKYYKNPDMYAKVENCFAFPLGEHFFFIVISSFKQSSLPPICTKLTYKCKASLHMCIEELTCMYFVHLYVVHIYNFI